MAAKNKRVEQEKVVKVLHVVSEFKKDHRKTNPGLHLLYVTWALRQLALAERMATQLYNESNTNTSAIADAIMEEVTRLIKEDAAWSQAAEMLRQLKTKPLEPWHHKVPSSVDVHVAEEERRLANGHADVASTARCGPCHD